MACEKCNDTGSCDGRPCTCAAGAKAGSSKLQALAKIPMWVWPAGIALAIAGLWVTGSLPVFGTKSSDVGKWWSRPDPTLIAILEAEERLGKNIRRSETRLREDIQRQESEIRSLRKRLAECENRQPGDGKPETRQASSVP